MSGRRTEISQAKRAMATPARVHFLECFDVAHARTGTFDLHHSDEAKDGPSKHYRLWWLMHPKQDPHSSPYSLHKDMGIFRTLTVVS